MCTSLTISLDLLRRESEYSPHRKDKNHQPKTTLFETRHFAFARESEKLTYFALCYCQTTLVITAPSDNSGQESFLGYTWSNRKGQEGIQVKNEGGLLYCPADRRDENTLAALVRSSFDETHRDIGKLKKYYHWMKLKDMLDFSGVEFNKALKVTRSSYSPVTYTGEYDLCKLDEVAPYVTEKTNITDISLSDYVTTDNMLKDKAGITEYQGTPQISVVTKYQPGDILVSNIRPYLKKIWFSDRDGGCSNDVLVFRSYDREKLMPEYLFIVLEQDAFFDYVMTTAKGMKMPRGDKKNIKNFEFPIPPINVQQQIIKEFHAIDEQIKEQEAMIKKCDEDVKSRFIEMFGDLRINPYSWEIQAFDELTELITDGEHATPRRTKQGIYLLSARNVLNHSLQLDDVDYIDEEE